MPFNQTPAQKLVANDVMKKFKKGDLKSATGEKITSREQAEAAALRESGSSKDVSEAENRRTLEKALEAKVEKEKSY